MTIKPIFAWYDIWIGTFWDQAKRRLYIFPVPRSERSCRSSTAKKHLSKPLSRWARLSPLWRPTMKDEQTLAQRLEAALQTVPARRPKDRYAKYLVDERDIAAAAQFLRSLPSLEAVAWREKVDQLRFMSANLRKQSGWRCEDFTILYHERNDVADNIDAILQALAVISTQATTELSKNLGELNPEGSD